MFAKMLNLLSNYECFIAEIKARYLTRGARLGYLAVGVQVADPCQEEGGAGGEGPVKGQGQSGGGGTGHGQNEQSAGMVL